MNGFTSFTLSREVKGQASCGCLMEWLLSNAAVLLILTYAETTYKVCALVILFYS